MSLERASAGAFQQRQRVATQAEPRAALGSLARWARFLLLFPFWITGQLTSHFNPASPGDFVLLLAWRVLLFSGATLLYLEIIGLMLSPFLQ